jgi:hypothetical protein
MADVKAHAIRAPALAIPVRTRQPCGTVAVLPDSARAWLWTEHAAVPLTDGVPRPRRQKRVAGRKNPRIFYGKVVSNGMRDPLTGVESGTVVHRQMRATLSGVL